MQGGGGQLFILFVGIRHSACSSLFILLLVHHSTNCVNVFRAYLEPYLEAYLAFAR
jgi:hypothetical protein